MATLPNTKRLILKYRRYTGDTTMGDGTTYNDPSVNTSNIDLENTGSYGQGALTNQEIADLAVEAVNFFIGEIAEKTKSRTSYSYTKLALLFPEYLGKEWTVISTTSGTPTISQLNFLPADFGYWVSTLWVDASTTSPATVKSSYVFQYADPEYLDTLRSLRFDEQTRIPYTYLDDAGYWIYWIKPITGTGNITFTYIRKQIPVIVNTGADDILLQSKWDDKILNIMIERSEMIKKATIP